MSEIERLCKEYLETDDNKNLIHYLETHTVDDIGVSNILKVITVLDDYVIKLKEKE